jgi:DNA-binding response OmpR family regulator
LSGIPDSMNILVIEDTQRVAELIKRGLEEHGFNVTIAFDGEMGRRLARDARFELAVIDIVLPKVNGLDLCREIRRERPSLPIIMLTALGTTDDKVEGFDAGADDYLVKPFEMRELTARIRALLKRAEGRDGQGGRLLRCADLEIDPQARTATRAGTDIRLTPKEFALLEFMLRNQGRVLGRTEIAEKVWDTHYDTGTNFIDVYINYLRNKVDRPFGSRLIHTRPGMGFILREE